MSDCRFQGLPVRPRAIAFESGERILPSAARQYPSTSVMAAEAAIHDNVRMRGAEYRNTRPATFCIFPDTECLELAVDGRLRGHDEFGRGCARDAQPRRPYSRNPQSQM